MTGFTVGGEPIGNVIRIRRRVVVGQVTLTASRCDPDVVEFGALPGQGVVTRLAIHREVTHHMIGIGGRLKIGLVTGSTGMR